MSGKTVTAALAACVLALAAPLDAPAQTVTGSGYSVFVPHTEIIQEFGGRTVVRFSQHGFTTADDSENPLHLTSFDCTGISEIAGDTQASHGHCGGIDRDGDTYSLWWRGDATGGEWGFIAGTGKFSGVNGGGTYQSVAQWPDGKSVTRWNGEWEM